MSRLKRRFFFYSQFLNFRIFPSILNISTYLETLISINITHFEKDGSANFYINNSKKKKKSKNGKGCTECALFLIRISSTVSRNVASPSLEWHRSFILLLFVESVDEAAARCDVLHASIEPILEKKETPSPEKHALSTRFMRSRLSPRLQLSNIFFSLFSFPPSLPLSLSSSRNKERRKNQISKETKLKLGRLLNKSKIKRTEKKREIDIVISLSLLSLLLFLSLFLS